MDTVKSFNPFPGDSYDTPEHVKRSIWDLLLFRSRFSFYIRNFYVFIRSGIASKYTDYDGTAQTADSLKNLRIVESCGGKIHLRGLNNIDKVDGPAVFVGNHMSLLETALLHAFLRPRKNFCFVIKQSLLKVPFFGDIMRKLGCIAATRENPREDLKVVLEQGTERLKSGVSVVVFPQSHRTAVFDEKHFNTIAVKLAKKANVPLIPVALRTDFLSNGKILKDLGPVVRSNPVWFEFGEPVYITGNGREEHARIIRFIRERLIQWGCTVVQEDATESSEK